MKLKILIALSFYLLFIANTFSQNTTLQGKIIDDVTGEEVMFANVVISKDGSFVEGTITDVDGNYSFSNLDPGTCSIEISSIGYGEKIISDYRILQEKSNILNVSITQGIDLPVVEVRDRGIFSTDETDGGREIGAKEIQNKGLTSIPDLIKTTAAVTSSDDGEEVSIKAGLLGSTAYIQDGMRVSEMDVPVDEIESIKVVTGGTSAVYGDFTGGVVTVVSKGPSLKYKGSIQMETSEPLNGYGYNLLRTSLSGPIIKKKIGDDKEQSILGFRLSGQFRLRKDDDPSALPVYVVKDEVLDELLENPVQENLVGGLSTYQPAAQDLTNADMQVLKVRPNEEERKSNFTAVIQAKPTDKIDVRISGTYSDEQDQFTPGYGSSQTSNDRERYAAWRGTWTALNSKNNPINNRNRLSGILRLKHKIGAQEFDPNNPTKKLKKHSFIQNASYDLNIGVEKIKRELGDPRHGDNFFAYGHIGFFDYNWTPFLGDPDFDNILSHVDYRRNLNAYSPGTSNPVLSNYNNAFQDSTNENDFLLINGDYRNGVVHEVWGLHENVGTVYNLFSKRDNDFYNFKANCTFDLIPKGGLDKGRHSIQFGLNYEQRFLRGYDIQPSALWLTARGQVNRHLTGVDESNVIGAFLDPNTGLEYLQYAAQNNSEEFEGAYFYQRVRELDGSSNDQFFNVDKLLPEELSLDLFSAQELMDDSRLGLDFYGFDYTGKKLSNDVNFSDFFTSVDENGVRDHPIAAFKPIYTAVYLQDKFTYKDLILKLGLRVDRYDANTKVLKDPYTLYEGMNAKDFYAQDEASDLIRPENVADDFVVYVSGDAKQSNDLTAFRKGEQWYFPNGEAANGGNVVFGGGVVTPKRYKDRNYNIRSKGFDIDNSFTDYKPQTNWMPRLAFSFPISNHANFFAHYDVLVQRPSATQARATPLEYFYMEERSASTIFQNPNLQPQRTVDYEVGFQQLLTESSLLKITAHYREMRDMVQRRTYSFVANPVGSYTTYDNQDFGTVKGMTLFYEMKRVRNLAFYASYTLQFADGTGSDADSQAGITSRGNLRNLFPLTRDERHNFNLSLDLRYGSDKKYNGPKILAKPIFENAGINLSYTAVSGRPYSKELIPDVLDSRGAFGSINGSRLPWNSWLNLKVDKYFPIYFGDKENRDLKKKIGINVFFRVQNLLNQKNIIEVYKGTGSASDDGYLSSTYGEDAIRQTLESGQNLESYLDSYQWRGLNGTFYSLPRRMFLGASVRF